MRRCTSSMSCSRAASGGALAKRCAARRTRRSGLAVVAKELDPLLEDVADDAERNALYARVAAKVRTADTQAQSHHEGRLHGRIQELLAGGDCQRARGDSLPVVDDARRALRVSNAILLAFLFFTDTTGRATRSAIPGSSASCSCPAALASCSWPSRSVANNSVSEAVGGEDHPVDEGIGAALRLLDRIAGFRDGRDEAHDEVAVDASSPCTSRAPCRMSDDVTPGSNDSG